MKIRAGFVTNSSSVAYIVMIPQNFKIGEHISVLEQVKGTFEDEYGDSVPLDDLCFYMDRLVSEGELYRDGSEEVFFAVRSLCQQLGYILTRLDVAGGDGYDSIHNIGIERILDQIKKIGGFVENQK